MSKSSKTHVEIANKILKFTAESGMKIGDRLVESKLAELCKVSRSPIRTALKHLEDLNLVEKKPRRGYTLAFNPADPLNGMPLETRKDRKDLSSQILRDHFSRRISEHVTASELIRRYNAPRSLVLKTLDSLQTLGVIRKGDGQAWFFSRKLNDPSALEESYQFRLLLEPAAISSAGFSIDMTEAFAIRKKTQSLLAREENGITAAEFLEADQMFHRLIAQATPNRYISDALVTHLKVRRIVGEIQRRGDFRMRQSLQDHLQILDYLESGEFEIAADQMKLHLRKSNNQRPKAANRGTPALLGQV